MEKVTPRERKSRTKRGKTKRQQERSRRRMTSFLIAKDKQAGTFPRPVDQVRPQGATTAKWSDVVKTTSSSSRDLVEDTVEETATDLDTASFATASSGEEETDTPQVPIGFTGFPEVFDPDEAFKPQQAAAYDEYLSALPLYRFSVKSRIAFWEQIDADDSADGFIKAYSLLEMYDYRTLSYKRAFSDCQTRVFIELSLVHVPKRLQKEKLIELSQKLAPRDRKSVV